MASKLQSADLVDPLVGLSTISLFPRTFKDSMKAVESEQQDMENIHNYLKSMTLKNPKKLLEQAKTILSNSSEPLDSELPCHISSEHEDGAAAAKGKGRPQERRPALGRKRARFSLKPNASQPTLDLDSSIDIDQLEDPEEYFLAHEKIENAKKEIQKQRGDVLINPNQQNLSTNVRCRRPGILGKTVNYKHRYSSISVDNEEISVSSQKEFEMDNPSQSDYSPHEEKKNQDGTSEEKERVGDEVEDVIPEEGSVALAENKVNNLLDELLSTNCNDLDADGTVSLLRERLQIKSIDLDKLSFPSLDSVRSNDVKAADEWSLRPRKALSDIHNIIRRTSTETSTEHKQMSGSPVCPKVSTTLQRSPLTSLFLLKRRMPDMDPPNDPFSSDGIDASPASHSFPVRGINRQILSPRVGTSNPEPENPTPAEDDGKGSSHSGKLQSLMLEEDISAGNEMDSGKLAAEDLGSPFDKPIHETSSGCDTDMNIGSNGSHGGLKDVAKDAQKQTVTPEQLKLGIESLSVDQQHCNGNQLDQPGSTLGDPCLEEQTSQRIDIPSEQNETNRNLSMMTPNQPSKPKLPPGNRRKRKGQIDQETSMIPSNQQSKAQAPPGNTRKRKALSHRNSLAGAGSSWESGVRRSHRIKFRPLEYWNGERFLYGRIHGSLATVIGLKYASPAKGDGKPTFKVKSYVSDEYKELVELAALH
ncbi:PREDICTED: uncharacterized protein LOC104592284 isoform X2 [Nelumbo nucifera]|uniref:Uncharacterized protein LOC104592284 isoform X2 n=1 Tax=Nelumbo nucifera TaxID=4432 RepID=A0A1U7ZER7_NELNU|nr:PREDICTED: uncharacterized protein LOC104592284 isoform X2 [Nelumbo nucifera]